MSDERESEHSSSGDFHNILPEHNPHSTTLSWQPGRSPQCNDTSSTRYDNSMCGAHSIPFLIYFFIESDLNYKLKLISSTDEWVESCQPNPCQYEGKCVTSGMKQICQCKGHFTGRFCALTMCELDPCVFGKCELTNSGFKVVPLNKLKRKL